MSDPSYALQVAEAAALLADASVTDLVGQAVYDDLSAPDSMYPRICIGQHQVLGQQNTCFDPAEVYATTHIWAQGPDGRLIAKQIGAEAARVLRQPLTLTGHRIDSAVFESVNYLVDGDKADPDSLVAHGVLVIRYLTVPET